MRILNSWFFLIHIYYCQFIESLLCSLCNKFQPLEFLISVKIYHWVYYSAQFIIDWGGLNNGNSFLGVGETGKSKIRVPLSWLADGCPFAVLTHCRERKLRCLFLFLEGYKFSVVAQRVVIKYFHHTYTEGNDLRWDDGYVNKPYCFIIYVY